MAQPNAAYVFYGALVVLVGALVAAYPYRVARFSEQVDAVGSTRSPGDVEPASWNVSLTRWLGVAIVVTGLYVASLGVPLP